MQNAVAYLRVSGQSQLEGTGFDRQLEACTSFAAGKDFALVKIFEEKAIAGWKDEDERPAFQEMIAYMLDNNTSIILVEGLDRLARAMRVQEQLLLYLAAKDLTLYAANTGENITEAVTSDPMKKALVQIQGVFAELDKSMIVAKLRKGRERTKARHGRCEGQKPYGHYPGEAPVLARIRHLRAQGMQYHHIAERLSVEGHRSRSGGPWRGPVIAKIIRREAIAP
jgi:DNA invertase Pin-like site-specific DNA recombinase